MLNFTLGEREGEIENDLQEILNGQKFSFKIQN